MAAIANTSFPGLSSQDAAARMAQSGPNELTKKSVRPPWLDFLALFMNPLAIILLIAAAISRLIGETFDATLIAILVLLGATIDFIQSYRSRKIIEHLQAKVAATASVLRNNEWQELPRRELVIEDIIRLSAGDVIPADARLLEARDLYVQQAMLTGESAPAEKMASDAPPSESPNALNMVFVGTSVVSGTAIAKVVATGSHTAFGEIAARLSERAPRLHLTSVSVDSAI